MVRTDPMSLTHQTARMSPTSLGNPTNRLNPMSPSSPKNRTSRHDRRKSLPSSEASVHRGPWPRRTNQNLQERAADSSGRAMSPRDPPQSKGFGFNETASPPSFVSFARIWGPAAGGCPQPLVQDAAQRALPQRSDRDLVRQLQRFAPNLKIGATADIATSRASATVFSQVRRRCSFLSYLARMRGSFSVGVKFGNATVAIPVAGG